MMSSRLVHFLRTVCQLALGVSLFLAWFLLYYVTFLVQTTLPDQLMVEMASALPLIGCGSCQNTAGVFVCQQCATYNTSVLFRVRSQADSKVVYTVAAAFPDSIHASVLRLSRSAMIYSLLSPVHSFLLGVMLFFATRYFTVRARYVMLLWNGMIDPDNMAEKQAAASEFMRVTTNPNNIVPASAPPALPSASPSLSFSSFLDDASFTVPYNNRSHQQNGKLHDL
jgi:hypothetical protein